jgi:hypothetical protein
MVRLFLKWAYTDSTETSAAVAIVSIVVRW